MTSPLRVQFGAFELHEADARLKRDGRPIPLPPKAFGVLCALVRQPGTLVSKNALLDTVWGHQHVSESVLKTVISQVRSALEDDASHPRFVETASRLGYRFIGNLAAPADRSPSAPVTPVRDGFIGRERELAQLQAGWDRVKRGGHHLVWIAGDAGIGKSTLVETFVSQSGATVVAHGQCVEQYGAGESYLPVLQGLGDLCRAYQELVSLMRSCAPTWLLQLPWLLDETERASLARELAGVSSERMLREFQQLLLRFTAQRPLLLVIEDLHWADIATLKLMDHFARQREAGNVLWVATFRLTQVIAEEHPLKKVRQELRMHRLCEELIVDCFSELEVQRYLHSQSVSAGDSEDFVRHLHSHTDGLPLFLVNVVKLLRAEGTDKAMDASLPVPEDLLDAVERRIALLMADAVSVLEAAAVCGQNFSARLVATVVGRPYEAVIATCDQLVKKQYWLRQVATVDRPDGSLDAHYAFRHAVYRHAFYLRTGDAQRIALHRRCAQGLTEGESLGGVVSSYAELAYHHERGRQAKDAISAHVGAARLSLRSFAPRIALEHCQHATNLLSQVSDAGQRQLLELGAESARGAAAAQLHGVGSDESRALFERVRELTAALPQHPARIAMLSGLGGSLFMRAEYSELEKLAAELDNSSGDDQPILAFFRYIFRAWAAAARGESRVAAEWWTKLIEFCERIEDRRAYDSFILDPEVGARANALRTFYERGLFDRARREALRAIARAERVRNPLSLGQAHGRAGMLEVRFENPERVMMHANAVGEIAESASLSQLAGIALYLRGWACSRLGDPKGGLKLINQGLQQQLRVGAVTSCTEIMGYAAEALVLAKDWAGAEAQLAQAFARARELGEWFYAPMLTLTQAQAAAGRGDASLALATLREALKIARRQEARGFELKIGHRLVEHPGALRRIAVRSPH